MTVVLRTRQLPVMDFQPVLQWFFTCRASRFYRAGVSQADCFVGESIDAHITKLFTIIRVQVNVWRTAEKG